MDAYLVLKNMTATEEDVADMKENRILMLDDDSDAFYLTKNSNDTQVQNLLDSINVAIHTIANSPDFSSEEFGSGVSSGIALQFKLVGFNNIASNIEGQFRKAILRRIDLLNNLFTLLDTEAFKVNVSFTHNLPQDIGNIADNINKLRGLVSDETLLAQVPFVSDVGEELDRIKGQGLDISKLYDFGSAEVGA